MHAVLEGDFRAAYLWLGVAAGVDASDGVLARRFEVKRYIPEFDGTLLDNLVDYLTWTFVPLVIIWKGGWLPEPAWPWLGLAAIGSLFAFCHRDAKQSNQGFFRGFPSYWNFLAFFMDLGLHRLGQEAMAALVAFLAVLSIVPVRFVYPNKAQKWKPFFLWAGWLSAPLWLACIALYPDVPDSLFYASTAYPVLYILASLYLDWEERRSSSA